MENIYDEQGNRLLVEWYALFIKKALLLNY
jgi:hypothetical protein